LVAAPAADGTASDADATSARPAILACIRFLLYCGVSGRP
jgi:hypothetical protein